VIYNDILAPFRTTKWSEKRGLLWNRLIVAIIGVYLFLFGLVYKIEGNVWDYLSLTGTVYLSSMSVLLISCCYWKRSNSWGAMSAIVLGAVVPVIHLTLQKIPSTSDFATNTIGPYYSGIAAFAAAALGMIVGSLIKPPTAPPEPRGFDAVMGGDRV
jgi:solute:Na+ symporter, SSS family